MNKLLAALAAGLLVLPILAWGQGRTAKPPVAKPAPTVQELVQQGKIAEAVRRASKSPNNLESTVQKLLASADVNVTARQIAEAQSTLDNTQKFLESYKKSSKSPGFPLEPVKGRQLRLQGIKLNDAREFSKAVTVLKEALEISEKTKDQTLEAGVHNNLGVALQAQDKLEEAKSEFEAASRIADGQKDPFRTGSYTFNLGGVQSRLNQFDAALNSYKRAEAEFKAASKTNLEARAVLMQGVTLGKINTVSPEALKYFERAQKMFEQVGDQRNAGWSFYLMGDNIAYAQKFDAAASYGERAIPYLTAGGDKHGLLLCYEFLTDMYQKLGKKDQAEKYKKLASETAKN
jgi:tetratricopeptide (TPR) repeat protein